MLNNGANGVYKKSWIQIVIKIEMHFIEVTHFNDVVTQYMLLIKVCGIACYVRLKHIGIN